MRLPSKTQVAPLLAFLAVSGCAVPPLYKEKYEPRPLSPVSEPEALRATYVAHHILDDKYRKRLIEEASENSDMKVYVASIAASQAITGSALSMHGTNMTGAISLTANTLLYFLSDSPEVFEDTSGIYVPERFAGAESSNPEEATQSAREYTVDRIVKAAASAHRRAQCIDGCETGSSRMVFRLDQTQASIDYLFDPESVYLTFQSSQLVESRDPEVTAAFLGYLPKFETRPGNNWRIELFISEDIIEDDPSVKRTLDNTLLADDIFRNLYADPFLYRVRSSSHPSRIYYDGKIYKIGVYNNEGLIKGELMPITGADVN